MKRSAAPVSFFIFERSICIALCVMRIIIHIDRKYYASQWLPAGRKTARIFVAVNIVCSGAMGVMVQSLFKIMNN